MVKNHVCAVAGAKGGVGKTTTSINLGAALARAGYRTVVVELDLAMANLVDFLEFDGDVAEEPTLHDVLAAEASVEAATYEVTERFRLVPSGTDIAGYTATDIGRLPEAVETLRSRNDVVLLDTPAGLSEEVVRPLELADEAIVVSTPRVSAVRNAGNTLELAERVDTPVRGLVLSKSGTGASPGAGRIAQFLEIELLGHVPEDDAVPHAQDQGRPVVFDSPDGDASTAYRAIAEQLVEAEGATAEGREPRADALHPSDEAGPEQRIEQSDTGHTDDEWAIASPGLDGGAAASASERSEEGDAGDRSVTSARYRQSPRSDETRQTGEQSHQATSERPQTQVTPAGEGRSGRRGGSTGDERTAEQRDDQSKTADERDPEATLGQRIRSLFRF